MKLCIVDRRVHLGDGSEIVGEDTNQVDVGCYEDEKSQLSRDHVEAMVYER